MRCIIAFALLVVPHMAKAECDMTCREQLTAQVELVISKLEPADQTLVASIIEILDNGKPNQLQRAHASLASKIADPEQRALWSEVLFVAMAYTGGESCFSRGFWFMSYVSTWQVLDDACMKKRFSRPIGDPNLDPINIRQMWRACGISDQQREQRFNKAQAYLLTRHNQAGKYSCVEETH